MASFNKSLFMGHLTRDPELRYTTSGTAVCDFGLAVNSAYKTNSGEKREGVYFAKCVAWGKQAEAIAKYLKKSSPAFVECRAKLNEWETKDGSRRQETVFTVESIKFLSGGKGDTCGSAAESGDEPQGGSADDEVPF